MFDERQARKDARRYRRRGLGRSARWISDAVRVRGVAGKSVLEVGGGIGDLQFELLEAGAARAVNVELSPGYEATAAELIAEGGVEDKVERRLGDFVREGGTIEPTDVVVMNRVVCCYPDYDALVGAAADHAQRTLVFTFPRDGLVVRAAFAGANLFLRLRGTDFRAFVHPRRAMLAVAESHGLRLVEERAGLVWRLAALERPASAPSSNAV
jgi:magnesium-protoporphyrin O-methyltransferase